ncbi:unnamed protein product [Durusdinium trenchii]|uniref:non-specific serine/threonine protein kinase n=1 Tax=Durusdinium trenchii TaxID=1381693 RepID=A0ABP0LF50_9DINO
MRTAGPDTTLFDKVGEPCLFLGRGAFGEVSLVKCKDTGTGELHLALKRVRLQLSDAGIATARQEAQLLWQLSQESVGILQCFAFRMVPEPVLTLELLLEFAPLGDLCRRLRLCKEAEVVAYTYDVAQGLSFLHGLRPKIFHRDVKPANIMLCYPESSVTRACPRAKLADFGVAKVMESEASTAGTATFIGTPHYLSPEVFSGDTYDERADAWALGCVLYEMMCFCRPFHFAETNVAIMALRISQGHYDRERLSQAMGRYPEGLLQTAEGLLRLELSERLRAIDLVESLGSFGFLDEARAESPLPSCWDPLPIDGAGTSSEVRLDTDSWHGAHVASDSSSTQLLAVLEASESPYTLGHLNDPIYGEVLTLPALHHDSRLGGLDILDTQYGSGLPGLDGVARPDDMPP